MGVFVGYFDASGDREDPNTPALSLAGFLSSEGRWNKFERDWKAVLSKENISIFHMKDFAHSFGQFKGWKDNEPRRRAFLQALHRIIRRRTMRSVSATLILSEYEWVNQRYQLREVCGLPYAVAGQLVITLTTNWMRRHRPKDDILFAFEKGDEGQGELLESSRHFRLKVDPIFLEKDASAGVPLQAADFIAYEHGKVFNDLIKTGKKRLRVSALPFVPSGKSSPTVKLFDRVQLLGLCRDLRIPRRRAAAI